MMAKASLTKRWILCEEGFRGDSCDIDGDDHDIDTGSDPDTDTDTVGSNMYS